MLSAAASVLVSGVVLFATLTSVCYLVAAALRWRNQLRSALHNCRPAASAPAADKSCARCGRPLSALPLGPRRRLHCAHCRLPVCRPCCARASNHLWLCVSCRKLRDVRLQSGEWFYQQLRQRFRSTVAALDNSDKNDGEVQEFLEKLVETVIGGGLDDISLYPLSDRPEYTNFCARYKDPLVHVLRRLFLNLKMALSDTNSVEGEGASDLHTELKNLMKQIIHDAMTQPHFKEGNGQLSWPPPEMNSLDSLSQRSYEDILATAILNKIFAKHQLNRPRRKEKNNTKTFDKNSNLLSDKSTGHMQDELSRSETDDSDSIANSLEDNSWSDSNYVDGPMSVTIEECIEEVTTRYSSDDEEEPKSEIDKFLSSLKYMKHQRAPFPELGKDIIDGGASSSDEDGPVASESELSASASVEQLNPVDSWEENWLFQRRKLKTNMGTCQPVPVPMLVPNPSADFRAMIGDVDADEMSDLSDCSDSVLEDLVDGPDDKTYLDSQVEDSDSEKLQAVAADTQREMFLQFISNDLTKLIPQKGGRGMSPDVGATTDQETYAEVTESSGAGPTQAVRKEQEIQATSAAELSAAPEPLSLSPETDSSNSYSIAETRNLNVPIVQVDSGEGSLDMQQDQEYTVAYATLAQVRSGSHDPSPSPTPSPSPKPKPRTVVPSAPSSELLSSGSSKMSVDKKMEEEPSATDTLSLPPKPGTLAEREHQKWEKAPPLLNNPYSKENIARRQRQRMYLSRHSSSENSIYVRDYYINASESREDLKPAVRQIRSMSAEPRSSTHTATTPLDQQQQVSVRVEVEVAVNKTGVPTHTQSTAHHHQVSTVVTPEDQEYISLPSVRELAKQFSTPDDKVPVPTSPIHAKNQMEVRLHSPVRQVHSLTARNLSREFRETLRKTTPIVKVADKELDSSGHVSEDSGTVSPTPCPPPRRLRLQEDIQFWEQLRQQR